MRWATASFVAWSGRGPVLLAIGMSSPEAGQAPPPRVRCAGEVSDAGDRAAVFAARPGCAAAVLYRTVVRDPGCAGGRGAVDERSTYDHRNVDRGGLGRTGALVACAPVLLPRGVGPGPGGSGPGPRGRGAFRARWSGGHRPGGRHPVPPLRPEGHGAKDQHEARPRDATASGAATA